MAITLQRAAFGDYTMLTLGDGDTYVQCVPERSAYVHQVCLGGQELLWNYPDAEALTGNSGHRNLALLPFPNRLLEGTYRWGGRELAFEVNKPDTRSALHGFGPHAPFTLERVDFGRSAASLELTYLHRGSEHPGSYPFDVRFAVTLSLDAAARTLTWASSAMNLEQESVPVGLGWHPYFLLPGGAEAWQVVMPPNEQVVLEKAIPTGARSVGLSPKQASPIDTDWDDCFALTDASDREVRLQGPDYTLSLKQGGDTRYTQLYVPPDAGSVAVEPMSCGVNAFQTAQEEVKVARGARVSTSMTLSLEPGRKTA